MRWRQINVVSDTVVNGSVAKVKQTLECSVDLFDASACIGGFGVCVILSNRK